MTLLGRIVSGELRNQKVAASATVATRATEARAVATVATVAEVKKAKSLTIAEQSELRRLVIMSCEPHESDDMFLAALPFGQYSLATYRGILGSFP